jgi:hypothetical protein
VADWEVDSPRLRNNLLEVLRDARDRAVRRDVPTVEDARRWQRDTMAGLDVPDTEYVGRFRGEPGLETRRVWIGSHEGVRPGEVAREPSKRTLSVLTLVKDRSSVSQRSFIDRSGGTMF